MKGGDAPATDWARLHVIFYDSNLCHGATLLKVGAMQILLAMLEEERIVPALILDDPLAAVLAWSRDPTLRAQAKLVDGRRLTAAQWQLELLEEVARFVETGGCDDRVPRAGEILDLWRDTVVTLDRGDLDLLSGRLDWVLKLSLLERALDRHPGLDWDSPEIKTLDHLYASLDRDEGLYWACERSGQTERWVDEETVGHFESEPPSDTRAWGRAGLLRTLGTHEVERVCWDRLEFRGADGSLVRMDLTDPLGSTRRELGAAQREWLEALVVSPSDRDPRPRRMQTDRFEPAREEVR